MADSPGRRRSRRESLDASHQSSGTAARSPPGSKERRRATAKPIKERWLLTRKTWRYMADAGRRLIPESMVAAASSSGHNQSEDIPKIEQFFQEVCSKEPRFLLLRKSSYPGTLVNFRSARKRLRRIGGSCRIKPSSADEADHDSRGSNSSFGVPSSPVIRSGRLDFNKVKREWLLTDHHKSSATLDSGSASSSPGSQDRLIKEDAEARVLADMLQRFLNLQESQSTTKCSVSTMTSTSEAMSNPTTTRSTSGDHSVPGYGLAKEPSSSTTSCFDYQKLIEKLEQHLNQIMSDSRRDDAYRKAVAASPRSRRAAPMYPVSATSSTMTSFNTTGNMSKVSKPYQSDLVHQSLVETLQRYYSKSPNREHVISAILTDRKFLDDLQFSLRRARNFRGPRPTGVYSSASSWKPSSMTSSSRLGTSSAGGNDERDGREVTSPLPLIAVQEPSIERGTTNFKGQTDRVSRETLEYCLQEREKEEQLSPTPSAKEHKSGRRRSSLEDDVSPSVSDTIKRYLRMARKKSVDGDKADRFKRVNYDRNLRNIKAKGEITKPGDDDGNSKGCQTEANWMMGYREMCDMRPGEALLSDDAETTTSPISRDASSRSSIDAGLGSEEPTTPKHHQSFLSHLLHGGNAMQKSKSSSSVVHHSSRLVAKKIFKSRSKSSSRAVNVVCAWTPQGKCTWAGTSGRRVTLQDTPLRQLSDIERKVLGVVAVAKLQALNLGVQIRQPAESLSGGSSSSKPKRRAYLLKRKALTTGLFDNKAKEDKDKDANGSGLVFGLPLAQCLENDRMARVGSTGSGEMGYDSNLGHASRLGSRASFTSLFESTTSTSAKTDEGGSWESLSSKTGTTGSAALTGSDSGVLLELGDGHLSDFEVVPNIVRQCIKHLELTGLHMLGIFRVSPSKKRVRQLRDDWDCGRETKIGADQCPHDVAALLKEYFRDLPDALLCRDLYQAFVHTQKIRNRRLQHEALQHLVQLLPTPNRETLYALLNFLSEVAANSEDRGELIGNKMDKTNLATVFAPNILHCVKAGHARTELSAERAEERIDVINVVRALLEHVATLFIVPAALVDELYLHMMDSHPAELDAVLSRRADEQCQDDPELCCSETENYSVEELSSPTSPTSPTALTAPVTAVSSSSGTSSTSQRRLYSREECLHEAGGTGGEILSPRQPRRSNKRPSGRRKDVVLVVGDSSTGRSNSIDSVSSLEDHPTPKTLADSRKSKSSGSVITASLTIPMTGALTLNLDDPDIPYIEDTTNNVVKSASPNAPPRRQRQRAASGDDPTLPMKYSGGSDSAVGSSSTIEQVPSSPSWATSSCSPPASPDSVISLRQHNPEQQHTSLQRVSFTTSSELKQIQRSSMLDAYHQRPQQSAHKPQQASLASSYMAGGATSTRTPAYTPSITNIGGAVMRCKTEDIERMMSINCGELPSSSSRSSISPSPIKPSASTSNVLDHKKYTKRRYTDSRHQTRHIPDAETLSKSSSSHLPSMSLVGSRLSSVLHPHTQYSKSSGSGSGSASSHHSGSSKLSVTTTGGSSTTTSTSTTTQPTMWKRRELISSAPKRRGAFF